MKELQNKVYHFYCRVCLRKLSRRRQSYLRPGVCYECYVREEAEKAKEIAIKEGRKEREMEGKENDH